MCMEMDIKIYWRKMVLMVHRVCYGAICEGVWGSFSNEDSIGIVDGLCVGVEMRE